MSSDEALVFAQHGDRTPRGSTSSSDEAAPGIDEEALVIAPVDLRRRRHRRVRPDCDTGTCFFWILVDRHSPSGDFFDERASKLPYEDDVHDVSQFVLGVATAQWSLRKALPLSVKVSRVVLGSPKAKQLRPIVAPVVL